MKLVLPPKPTSAEMENTRLYWRALGKFIDGFANTEALMFGLLWARAGVSGEVARAVFSGARLDQAMGFIKRISDAKGRKRSSSLTAVFEQIGVINQTRNEIIHYGAQEGEGGRFVTNALVAHVPSKVRKIRISPSLLDEMSADLIQINSFLSAELARYRVPKADIETHLWKGPLEPWRYRPQQLAAPEHKARKTRLKRQRPRASSQA